MMAISGRGACELCVCLTRMTEGFGSAMLGTAAFALQNYSLTTLG